MATPWLSQTRSPLLWRAFQFLIGGTIDKQRLYRSLLGDRTHILEVGCSLGNTAPGFLTNPDVRYTGLDIDPVAIAHAQRRFASTPNATFVCAELATYAATAPDRFQVVFFAGILHHVPDDVFVHLLTAGKALLTDRGTLVVSEPLRPSEHDSWLVHRFMALFERGQHLRSDAEMRSLIARADLRVTAAHDDLVGATPLSIPKVARFGSYSLAP